jgi:His/Glu/Gln/Arg/opine family amino acid ABC transporter permease subunit
VNIDLSYTWDALPPLLYGAIITVEVSLAAMALSLVLATALTILQTSGNRIALGFVRAYISYVRGTPLLIQIFIIFYIVPLIGLELGPLVAGILALALSSAAFTTEIMRGGLAAIPKTQFEAAQSLGLSTPTIWGRVILPQMFNLILPPLVNEFTLVIKATPLISVITVVELMRIAQQIYNENFRPFEVLLGVAMIFFVLNFALTRVVALLEQRAAAIRA